MTYNYMDEILSSEVPFKCIKYAQDYGETDMIIKSQEYLQELKENGVKEYDYGDMVP